MHLASQKFSTFLYLSVFSSQNCPPSVVLSTTHTGDFCYSGCLPSAGSLSWGGWGQNLRWPSACEAAQAPSLRVRLTSPLRLHCHSLTVLPLSSSCFLVPLQLCNKILPFGFQFTFNFCEKVNLFSWATSLLPAPPLHSHFSSGV